MRRVSLLAVLAALCSLVVAAPASAADCPGADLRPAQDNMAQVADATLCLLNAERAGHGLGPLSEQGELTKASRAFSALMVDQHFFAHVSPDGGTLTDRLEVSGYLARPGGWTVGENIAWGESYLASPARIVQAWMDSPPHRENILSAEFEEIGLGIVTGVPSSTNAGATYTTDFGRRTPSADSQVEADVAADASDSAPAAGSQTPVARKRSSARSPRSRRSSSALRKARAPRRAAAKHGRRAMSMRAIKAGVAR